MIEIRLLFVLHLLLVLHSYSCEHTLLSPIWNPWSKQYNWLDEDGRTSTLRFSFNPRRHPSTSSPRWDALCRWITVSEMLLMLDQHCRCRDRAFHLNCNCCVVEQQGVLNRLNPQYMLHQKSILIPQRIKQKDQFSSPQIPEAWKDESHGDNVRCRSPRNQEPTKKGLNAYHCMVLLVSMLFDLQLLCHYRSPSSLSRWNELIWFNCNQVELAPPDYFSDREAYIYAVTWPTKVNR